MLPECVYYIYCLFLHEKGSGSKTCYSSLSCARSPAVVAIVVAAVVAAAAPPVVLIVRLGPKRADKNERATSAACSHVSE